jgi:GAF domain-containing protein
MMNSSFPPPFARERPICFVGHSNAADWRDDILSACAEVLPKFGLEPWYAADHYEPTKTLRDKVVEAIANARYGIYDLSSWQDAQGVWRQPRNVLIELGIAIVYNRPTLLLRHTSNSVLPLPICLQGLELIEFAGEATLKWELERRLPQWIDAQPERDWLNRFCIFGNRACAFREQHPRGQFWGATENLGCHVTGGVDREEPHSSKVVYDELRAVVEDVLSRYRDLSVQYLEEVPLADGYRHRLCSYCQSVRSTAFGIYQLRLRTSGDVFVTIGMGIALEAFFKYDIPRVILLQHESDLPSLLGGYEVLKVQNSSETRRKLKSQVPVVIQLTQKMVWKPTPLPFVETAMEPSPAPPLLTDEMTMRLMALRQIDAAISMTLGHQDLLEEIVNVLSRFLPGASCTIHLYDPEKDEFGLRAATGVNATTLMKPRKDGMSAHVVQTRTPVFIEDVFASVEGSPGIRREFVDGGVRAFAGVPLISDGNVVGVLFLNYTSVHRFSIEDRHLVEIVASQAAIAVMNMNLMARSEKVESEGKLRHLVDEVQQVLQADCVVLYPYDREREMYYDREHIVNRGLVHPIAMRDKPRDRGFGSIVRAAGTIIVSDIDSEASPEGVHFDQVPETLNEWGLLEMMKSSSFMQREAIRAFLGLSLRSADREEGLLFVNYRTSHRFTQQELETANHLGSQLTAVLQRIHDLEA